MGKRREGRPCRRGSPRSQSPSPSYSSANSADSLNYDVLRRLRKVEKLISAKSKRKSRSRSRLSRKEGSRRKSRSPSMSDSASSTSSDDDSEGPRFSPQASSIFPSGSVCNASLQDGPGGRRDECIISKGRSACNTPNSPGNPVVDGRNECIVPSRQSVCNAPSSAVLDANATTMTEVVPDESALQKSADAQPGGNSADHDVDATLPTKSGNEQVIPKKPIIECHAKPNHQSEDSYNSSLVYAAAIFIPSPTVRLSAITSDKPTFNFEVPVHQSPIAPNRLRDCPIRIRAIRIIVERHPRRRESENSFSSPPDPSSDPPQSTATIVWRRSSSDRESRRPFPPQDPPSDPAAVHGNHRLETAPSSDWDKSPNELTWQRRPLATQITDECAAVASTMAAIVRKRPTGGPGPPWAPGPGDFAPPAPPSGRPCEKVIHSSNMRVFTSNEVDYI
ncbi:unnamed protein product, partial [Nesidiocoris tenuis]